MVKENKNWAKVVLFGIVYEPFPACCEMRSADTVCLRTVQQLHRVTSDSNKMHPIKWELRDNADLYKYSDG